jgi:hypothetical protein
MHALIMFRVYDHESCRGGAATTFSKTGTANRVSLYADDVVLFLRPDANDIAITVDILHLFGEASGLRTNL